MMMPLSVLGNRHETPDISISLFNLRWRLQSSKLPPLCDRTEDIPLLCRFFNSRLGGRITGITSEAMAMLMSHEWPGNVRALENAIE